MKYAIEARGTANDWQIGFGLNGGVNIYSDKDEAVTDAKCYEAMGYVVRVREYVAGNVVYS